MLNAANRLQFPGSSVPSWLKWPLGLTGTARAHCAVRDIVRQELTLVDAFGALAVGGKPLAGDNNELCVVVTGLRRVSSSAMMARRYACKGVYNIPHVVIGADHTHAVAGELIVWLHHNDDYSVEANPYPHDSGYRVTHDPEVSIVTI